MNPISARTRWLIVIIASIGFAFDIYELLMLPLILRPAVRELGGPDANIGHWQALLFYVPAVAGGIFGLLGGYLTDRLGRRRVLTWSILLYAVSAFASGFATSLPMLLVLRCLTFIGVCVEFVAAIAWLAELFPEPKQRERVLGYTQAFSSLGGLMVAVANAIAIKISPENAWRYTLMSGLIPALPLLVIRPFLPESPIWAQKKAEGSLRRPSIWELFAPEFRRTTIVTTIMFAMSYGVAFGAIQQIPQMVPGLSAGLWSVVDDEKQHRALTQKLTPTLATFQEIGGLVGRLILAFLAVRMVRRQRLIRLFQIPSLLVVPLVFLWFFEFIDISHLKSAIFIVGLLTVAQFSFWGNYLPLVYPVRLRGTGESFAANIGGRMIGTSFAAVTTLIATRSSVPKEQWPASFAMTAAGVAAFAIIVGLIASFFLPEPPREELPH